jgi:hypothetical protein
MLDAPINYAAEPFDLILAAADNNARKLALTP